MSNDNFLNKYKSNVNNWAKYNVSGGPTTTTTTTTYSSAPQQMTYRPAYGNYSTNGAHFETNDSLASEVLSKAGPSQVYQRPGMYHEVSNVTKLTTEVTSQPGVQHYQVNQDYEPIRIVRPHEPLAAKQNVRVRYLQPPELPEPAPIIIRERQLTPPPPAPPIIIRQHAQPPPTPPPLVIRERPPAQPQLHQTTFIDKVIPPPTPPPRQVIIERIPAPEKPREVIYEKWLPYKPQGERPVIVERSKTYERLQNPKNVIIEYEQPRVNVEQQVWDEGVQRADPVSYSSSPPPSNVEIRMVDRITDLPTANVAYSNTQYQPTWQPATSRSMTPQQYIMETNTVRPRSSSSSRIVAAGPAGPASYIGPWNTTYRSSYTAKNRLY